MTVLIPGLTVVIAWILALFNFAAPGAAPDDVFVDSAMRWMLFLPGGCMFLVSFFMHTVLAKKTAAQIGWQTNGFQYEIGFASLGFGVAGILAALAVPGAWLPIAAAQSIFLLLAAANHVREIAKTKNFAPGNTLILVYDIALPASYIGLLIALGG